LANQNFLPQNLYQTILNKELIYINQKKALLTIINIKISNNLGKQNEIS